MKWTHLIQSKDGLKPYIKPEIKFRQILRFFGYGMFDTGRWAVYKDPSKTTNNIIKVVNIDHPELLQIADRIRPIREKFGIGWYYEEPEQFATEEEIKRGIEMAQQYEAEQKKKELEREKMKGEAFKFFSGNEIIEKKDDEMFIVIKAFYNNSDSMTDYFEDHYPLSDGYVLAVVPKGRQTENKIRKLVNDIPELSKFSWKWNKENWSGGHGNWMESEVVGKLREKAYDGREEVTWWLEISYDKWTKQLKKSKLFVDYKKKGHKEKAIKNKDIVERGNIEIVDYSEKAIAVFGDTKPIKDNLKELGGRFNPFLKWNGEKKAGWVFPMVKKEDVLNYLGVKQL